MKRRRAQRWALRIHGVSGQQVKDGFTGAPEIDDEVEITIRGRVTDVGRGLRDGEIVRWAIVRASEIEATHA